MRMKSKIYIILICAVILTGCTQATPLPTAAIGDPFDRSLFTGNPCAAPCWHGLAVGRSTEKEVVSTLQKLNYINQDTIQISQSASGTEITASCISTVKECLKFNVSNDLLTKIVVGLTYEMRVDEAIEHLGQPHYLGVSSAKGEIVACEVYMIWRNSGLVLASTFATDSEDAGKYCDVVRSAGKVPSSLLIAEARLISGVELITILTSDSQIFSFSGTLDQ
jgi:hypothetical protein